MRWTQSEKERLDRIVPGPERDLRWQEQLTGTLLRARPNYEDPAGDWPAVVEDVLGVPVDVLSYGPTATSKLWSRGEPPWDHSSAAGSIRVPCTAR